MIPMGPGPETATTSPGSISVSSNTAWTEHARGSQSAPAWRSRFSDRGKTIPCRTAQYLAKPPFIVLPWAARSTQKNGAPIWQYRHWPQSLAADGLIATLSPCLKRVTPWPTSATVPHISWPRITGGSMTYSLLKMWISVPQTPALCTSMTTWSGPAVGSGMSTYSTLPGSQCVFTTAFMCGSSLCVDSTSLARQQAACHRDFRPRGTVGRPPTSHVCQETSVLVLPRAGRWPLRL